MTKRTCSKCGNRSFDKGRLVMNAEVIRFETTGLRDPRLTAHVCMKCGNAELTIKKDEKLRSLFLSLDEGIKHIVRERGYCGTSTASFPKGGKANLTLNSLAKSSGLKLNEVQRVIEKYVERRKRELDLGSWGFIRISLSDEKDIIIMEE